MKQYHKIQSVFKRHTEGELKGQFKFGEWTQPEFDYLKNSRWIWDEKIDGTNIRVMWDGKQVTFGGKTDNAQIPVKLLYVLQARFPAAKLLRAFGIAEVCLYGEGFGAKIQKGGGNYIADGVDFILFDVKIGDFWLEPKAVKDIACGLEILPIPFLGRGTLEEAISKTYDGFNSTFGDFQAEGLILRPDVQLFNRQGHRIITKVKCKDFK